LEIADGAFVANMFDTPEFSVTFGGRIVNEFGMCNTDAVEAAGWFDLTTAQVSADTRFAFYETVFVPAAVTGAPELIIVGDPSGDAIFFEATILSAVPAP
jgi:hypothetical protein